MVGSEIIGVDVYHTLLSDIPTRAEEVEGVGLIPATLDIWRTWPPLAQQSFAINYPIVKTCFALSIDGLPAALRTMEDSRIVPLDLGLAKNSRTQEAREIEGGGVAYSMLSSYSVTETSDRQARVATGHYGNNNPHCIRGAEWIAGGLDWNPMFANSSWVHSRKILPW